MKMMMAVVTAAMLSSPVLAQDVEPPRPSPQMQRDLGDWARSLAEKEAAEARQSPAAEGSREGRLRIVSFADWDAPASIKDNMAEGIRNRRHGPLQVAPGVLRSTSEVIAGLTRVRRSDAELRQRLSYAPADVSGTPIGTAALLSKEPSGMINGERSTGLSRGFQLPVGDIVILAEDDYHASATKLTLIREALNTEVNGTPATSYAARSNDGRGKAELRWVTPIRSYSLTLVTDEGARIQRAEKLLLKIARGIQNQDQS